MQGLAIQLVYSDVMSPSSSWYVLAAARSVITPFALLLKAPARHREVYFLSLSLWASQVPLGIRLKTLWLVDQ
jgi:hypothetical protein